MDNNINDINDTFSENNINEEDTQEIHSQKQDNVVENSNTSQNNDIDENNKNKNDRDNTNTVVFDTVTKQANTQSSKGIKVFFTLISIVFIVILAVAAGFIFGKNSKITSDDFSGNTSLHNKGELLYQSNKSKIYKDVVDSVVGITVYTEKSGTQAFASGVVYTSDGYIVTNDHIYANINSPLFKVTFSNGDEYDAKFIAGDTRSDLAVLKINATGLKKAIFVNSEQVEIGEDVVAIGYPSGATEKAVLTSGNISSDGIRISVSTSSYTMKMIQCDAAINPGSSGGALVNMASQIVGITSVKLAGSSYDSVSYAIPSNTVVKIIDSLIKNGVVKGRGKLGITYTMIDSVLSGLNGVPQGMMISEIVAESNLSDKNIKSGDIITHINDIEIVNRNIALDIIENTEPNIIISFTVYHADSKTSETIYATLIEDIGTSSYINGIIELPSDNPFNENDDFYSDH